MTGRYYDLAMMGPVCRYCRTRVPAAIATDTHPTCGPST